MGDHTKTMDEEEELLSVDEDDLAGSQSESETETGSVADDGDNSAPSTLNEYFDGTIFYSF